MKTPKIPYLPAAGRVGQTVGNGSGDVSPQVSGTTITWAKGSFPQVTNVSSNSAYSLQLNTDFKYNVTLCRGASDPKQCQGWEQFLYASVTDGGPDMVYIQYWLINYNNVCPSGWNSFQNSCFTDSAGAAAVPGQPLSNLASLTLTATAGNTDSVTMSVGNGVLYSVSQASVHNLSAWWSTAEFNVVGNGNGSQVSFNAGSTVVVQTVTSSASGTRSEPSNSGQSFTAETNNLTVVPGSVCQFGGNNPGIQFMESNVARATPPVCPSLALTPNPVPVPEGATWSSNIAIAGNLVGQSSNAALLPSTCTVSGPVAATVGGGVRPWIDYSIPWGTAVGSTFVETITCDNGQSTQQNIIVAAPLLTASPTTLEVLENGCAANQYAGANLNWVNVGYGYCDTVTYTISSPLPPGIHAYTSGPFVAVCDASRNPQSFALTVTSNGCAGVGPATTGVQVNVVGCIPQTSCGRSCQAAMPDGCGGTINCSSNCTGLYTCTAPQGETAGLMCCGPGQYIPAGGTACVCENGGTWNSALEECVPPPTCPTGTVYCAYTDTCLPPRVVCRPPPPRCHGTTCS